MFTTYSVISGDTFESIARKKYGTEKEADKIANANPGVAQPLTAGTTLTVPALPGAPQNVQQQAPSNTADEVAITIEGKRFRFWSEVRITRAIDTMDIVEFSAPFDADAPGFRETFRPFSFKDMNVTVGGAPLFTGTVVAVSPSLENSQKLITVSGYSLPGVLNDCTPPAGSSKLEFNDQGLLEIAKDLAAPFGISVDFQADQGAVFERVAIMPEERILAFLIKLAQRRSLVISSSSRGKLVFLQSSESGAPVANLAQGVSPVLSIKPFFSPQEYYSHITGIEYIIPGYAGSQFTVKNPRLGGVVRPLTYALTDTFGADVKDAVEAKAGRMFGNMVSYSIKIASWRDSSGKLWAPNSFVTLLAPDAMIYSAYIFVIRSVEFNRDRASGTATLNLVIPGAFSGSIPEVLPWDE